MEVRGMNDGTENPLLGRWISDPNEPAMWKRLGRSTMEFFPDGTMRHKLEKKGAVAEFKYKYAIQKNILVLSAPPLHDARSRFEITADGKLILHENRKRYQYIRMVIPSK
jgi:hypothetical protein